MSLIHVNRGNMKYRRGLNGHSLWAILVALIYACGLASCGDTNNVSPPPAGPGPLTIVTSSPLPSGTVNQPYATALGGSGGITPYTWSLASGSPALLAGLFLDATAGTITGTPTAPGTTTPIFRLADSSSPEQAVQKALTITITLTPQPLAISTSSLPEGTVNQPYDPTALQATGGIQPYTWSVNPALPNGLQVNVLSPGTISGTPLNGTAGTTTHTFTVADSDAPNNQTTTAQLSLKINPAPTPLEITSPAGNSLPNARVGKKYSTTLKGSGGVPPYTWSITPALPTGLLLNTSTGAITGKPAHGTSGIYSLTITLQDSSLPTNQSTNKPVILTVLPH
ncbi:MAG TPA: Ig domain-containing protein [Nitrospiraceae bacterium]|nr:Ig domain-containing protein [Nitrospiraceae bacterium]